MLQALSVNFARSEIGAQRHMYRSQYNPRIKCAETMWRLVRYYDDVAFLQYAGHAAFISGSGPIIHIGPLLRQQLPARKKRCRPIHDKKYFRFAPVL